MPGQAKTPHREEAKPDNLMPQISLVNGQLGLSGKLLILTILFVMIAEVLIFLPSVANFRKSWLTQRLSAAQIASLAAEAAPSGQLPAMLKEELLKSAMVRAVAIKRGHERRLILQEKMPSSIDSNYDLRNPSSIDLIIDALAVFGNHKDRVIRVIDQLSFGPNEFIEIVISEAPLKAAMIRFSLNILGLSIIISIITAALVYFSLNWLLIRPMMNITRNMVRFGENPEDTGRIIKPTGRTDELGVAENELAAMQSELSLLLSQKNRLAALGLAVSKINHDLRNMLANAQLISDRFGTLKEPTVQRFAPKLIKSLDRAIDLCTQTLKYGRAQELPPQKTSIELAPLLTEIAEGLGLPRSNGKGVIGWETDLEHGFRINADRDQLFRVLSNICRNAVQVIEQAQFSEVTQAQSAIAPIAQPANEPGSPDQVKPASPDQLISVKAWSADGLAYIEISDTGPGISEQAREHLFEAFQGSARTGGTGLGLAIAAELMRAHGGDIELMPSSRGATFRLTLPD